MWSFYNERTAGDHVDRTRASSEQRRGFCRMSQGVVAMFRGRRYQKPLTDRTASVLQGRHNPVRRECLTELVEL